MGGANSRNAEIFSKAYANRLGSVTIIPVVSRILGIIRICGTRRATFLLYPNCDKAFSIITSPLALGENIAWG